MEDDVIVCDISDTSAKKNNSFLVQMISYLFEKCPDLHQLNGEKSRTIREMFSSLKGRYLTVKGHIQSGKTNFMICASTLFLLSGYSVVIVLRNNKADQEQTH